MTSKTLEYRLGESLDPLIAALKKGQYSLPSVNPETLSVRGDILCFQYQAGIKQEPPFTTEWDIQTDTFHLKPKDVKPVLPLHNYDAHYPLPAGTKTIVFHLTEN